MMNFRLNDGNEIPAIGFGVFMMSDLLETADSSETASLEVSE